AEPGGEGWDGSAGPGAHDLQSAAVTGATGLLGRWLLLALTRRGARVQAFLRGGAARAEALIAWLIARGGRPELVTFHPMELAAPDLGLDDAGQAALRDAQAVFHLAARFGFNLSREEAWQANVAATERLVERLAGSTRLLRLVHVSGYRTEGGPARALDANDPQALDRFYRAHGAYEASKMEAHQVVQRAAAAHGVPLTVVSPSSVIGDSRTGETTQRTGLAELVERLWRGQLPALAGTADTWLPVVPVDAVAEILAAVPTDAPSLGANLVVLDERTPTLQDFLRQVANHLGVAPPAWTVPVGVLAALPRAITGVEPESLSFLSEDRYDTAPLHAFMRRNRIALPALEVAVARWLDHLVDTDFLRIPAAGGRLLRAAGRRVFARGEPTGAEAVLLHGLMLGAGSWAETAARLARPTFVPELPGLGRSDPGGGAPADWLQGVLTESEVPPVLVGHSLGTAFAVQYALRHPNRIRGLVLVAPFFLQGRPGWSLRQAWLTRWVFRTMSRGRLAGLLDEPPGEALDEAVSLLTRPEVARHTARWLAWAAREDVRAELREALARVEVPVAVVYGARDPLRYPLPTGVEALVVEGTGHYPQLSHPEVVAGAVRALQGAVQKSPTNQLVQDVPEGHITSLVHPIEHPTRSTQVPSSTVARPH
ncbi:MAG: alpha/beta fold hydrolase, partial [Myxococcales bacterium]|nr:alpha/beta fold hydrolase [Myxococcales bacterium]